MRVGARLFVATEADRDNIAIRCKVMTKTLVYNLTARNFVFYVSLMPKIGGEEILSKSVVEGVTLDADRRYRQYSSFCTTCS